MKFVVRVAAVAVLIAALAVNSGVSSATPEVALSVSSTTVAVGETVTLTSHSTCDVDPCRYQWRWYRVSAPDRLGTGIGEGETVETTFDSPGLKLIVLKVTNATTTHSFATADVVLEVVGTADPEPTPTPTPLPTATDTQTPASTLAPGPTPTASSTPESTPTPVPEPTGTTPTDLGSSPAGSEFPSSEPTTAEPTDEPDGCDHHSRDLDEPAGDPNDLLLRSPSGVR
jgi:hypothetical protein